MLTATSLMKTQTALVLQRKLLTVLLSATSLMKVQAAWVLQRKLLTVTVLLVSDVFYERTDSIFAAEKTINCNCAMRK